MPNHFFVQAMCTACVVLFSFVPGAAQGLRDRLKGLVYEVEDYTEPRDAWMINRASPDRWNLWSNEEDVLNKRSGGRSLQSPRIEKDRSTPQEGAPPLHTRITGIPRGTYRAFAGPPVRRIAISFDGKTWEMREGGAEIDLGLVEITDGTFELWVDDRYATPNNIGPCYYDYIRFEPFVAPRLSSFAVHRLVDPYERVLGSGANAPGVPIQLSWVTDQPVATGTVEYGIGGRFDRRTVSQEVGVRNHRVILGPISPGIYQGRIHIPFGRTTWVAPTFRFTVPPVSKPPRSRSFRVPLTVLETTERGRQAWPVTSGIPLPQGVLADARDARVEDAAGRPVPCHGVAASLWPDGSVRWLAVTFLADTQPGATTRYSLVCGTRKPTGSTQTIPFVVAHHKSAEGFALFRDLALDANGNGKVEPGEVFSGEPQGGNLRLLDAAMKEFCMAPGAKVRLFENALRRDTVAEGLYTGPEGEAPFRWRAALTTFAGQPWVSLRFSVANPRVQEPHTLLSGVGLRLPIAGSGPVEGAFDLRPFGPIGNGQPPTLLQDLHDHYSIESNGIAVHGRQSLGLASVRRDGKCLTAFVRDFWQTYPKGFALKPDGLHIRILPLLPPNAYEIEAADGDALIRLFYPYRGGKYQFNRSLEFTTEIYVLLEQGTDTESRERHAAYAAWFNHPLFAVPDPAAACASGVLGPVGPATPNAFAAYTRLVERGFEAIEKNRQDKREFGWMNYGDWHGERRFNWGNLEYDLQWALGLEFMRTGNLRYLWRGEQAARHSVTIDTIHAPWNPRMPGLQWTHSVGHIGGFFDRDDERFRKFGNVFGLARPDAPNPFVAGVIDPAGHTFVAGNLLYAMLLGDPRMLEVAERIASQQAAYLTPNFHFGIERAAGWPLVNAVEAYEMTGNPFYLNAARLYFERIFAQQHPEIGDFRLRHGPPECLHAPPHVGGKAFATGVLLYGLMRYHLLTNDPAAKTSILRSARWLARDSWNSETQAFRYISTCPTFEKPRGNGATDLLCAPGLAYALTLGAGPEVRSVLLDSLSRALTAAVADGKAYAGMIRQTPYALHLLTTKLGVHDLQPPVDTSHRVTTRPTLHVARGHTAPLRVFLTRSPHAATLSCEVRVAGVPSGWQVVPTQVTFTAPDVTSASPPFQVRATPTATTSDLVLRVLLNGQPFADARTQLLPQEAPETPPAPNASGIGVLGKPDSPTARALASRPGVTLGVAPEEITRYCAVVLPCDHFAAAPDKPELLLGQLSAFARGGGTVVLFQINDDTWHPGLLPLDLVLSDANGELAEVVAPDHPLFAGIAHLRKVVCYDTVTFADPAWKVLARDNRGGPAILEATTGKGKVLLVEPSLDRIAAGTETPPDGVVVEDCRRFFTNLVTWAIGG